MINGEIKKTYRINEQQAKGEWVYSGFTVGLQWVYSGSTTNKRRTKDEQKTNDERRNNESK